MPATCDWGGRRLLPQNNSPGARPGHTLGFRLWRSRGVSCFHLLTPLWLISVTLKTFHGQTSLGKVAPSKVKPTHSKRRTLRNFPNFFIFRFFFFFSVDFFWQSLSWDLFHKTRQRERGSGS